MEDAAGSATEPTSLFHLWLYGSGAVIFISVIGLLSINIIPLFQKHRQGDFLQLLVGLAIGTLTSDALLHLLPHAFIGEHGGGKDQDEHEGGGGHDMDHHHHEEEHRRGVLLGLMALMGIMGFLIFERILTILSDLCQRKRPKKTSKVGNCNRALGEKVNQNGNNPHNNHHSHGVGESSMADKQEELEKLTGPGCGGGETKSCGDQADSKSNSVNKTTTTTTEFDTNGGTVVPATNAAVHHHSSNADIQLTTEQCHRETIVYQTPDTDGGFVVQLTDHHHHHQHQHPQGAKSVILMIVTGDGMHNFFDGLAIGVAFAGGGLSGGLSTSVAILFHELPHEVGDFAVLLNAGLSVRKAVMYNSLSAVLCFIGMTTGVLVGNLDTGLLSAIIAGMFLYIALVNMIPQLDCCPTQSETTRAFKLSVQVVGISIGVAIMCAISVYESRLQDILK